MSYHKDKKYNCKYCISYKKQKGGEWNSKKDAGIISGHGRVITDKFIVIPKGFKLRPLGTLGKAFNLSSITQDDLEFFKRKEDRSLQFDMDSVITNTKIGHVYQEGDIIPEMYIETQLTWDNNNGTITYFPAGVITEQTLYDKDLLKTNKSKNAKHDPKIELESMKYSDKGVNLEWFKGYLLSDIIKRIQQAGKAGSYWILACREGDLVINDKECGPEPLTSRLRTSQTNVLGSFTDKLKIISDNRDLFKFQEKRVPKIIREEKDLKDNFITCYLNEIEYNLEKNNFTIDSNLLCEVNILVNSFVIPFELYRSKVKSPFFKTFWDLYKVFWRLIEHHKKTQEQNKKTQEQTEEPLKKKHKNDGFRFIF